MRLDQQGMASTWNGPGAQQSPSDDAPPESKGGDFVVVFLCLVVIAGMGYILFKVSPDGMGFGLFGKIDGIEPPRLQALAPALSRILSTSVDATPVQATNVPATNPAARSYQITLNGKALPGNTGILSIVPARKPETPPKQTNVKVPNKAAHKTADKPAAQPVKLASAVATPTTRPTTRPALATAPIATRSEPITTVKPVVKPTTRPTTIKQIAAKPPPTAKPPTTPVSATTAKPVAKNVTVKPVLAKPAAKPAGSSVLASNRATPTQPIKPTPNPGTMRVVSPEEMKRMMKSGTAPTEPLAQAPQKLTRPNTAVVLKPAPKSGSI